MDARVLLTGATGYNGGRLLRRFEQRGAAAPHPSDVFTYRSIVTGQAADVFRWHERPEALLDLLPSHRVVRIERRTGGLRDGGSVTLSIGIGALRMRWEARHHGYIAGERFCDEQIRGPFRIWRHTHRFVAVGTGQTLYEDRVEYAVRGGRLVARLADPVVRHLLARMFARRHRIVHAAFTDARDAALRRRLGASGITSVDSLGMVR
ncbi:MAG TPA: SRPBCC family protein [Vicinamibacterales bacterium]|jgi:ligand-binding SRPBCC domain-containing protein|nr:SRPBCC family protein [Vicinamibacterales bacterium]